LKETFYFIVWLVSIIIKKPRYKCSRVLIILNLDVRIFSLIDPLQELL